MVEILGLRHCGEVSGLSFLWPERPAPNAQYDDLSLEQSLGETNSRIHRVAESRKEGPSRHIASRYHLLVSLVRFVFFRCQALITYLQGLPKYCLWRHHSMGGNGGA
jgi:hypothetical protein